MLRQACDHLTSRSHGQKNLIEEGLSKNLMNPKWKYQKELLFPVVVKDKDEIDKFRVKISKCYDQILENSEQLNYDNDQIISEPRWRIEHAQNIPQLIKNDLLN